MDHLKHAIAQRPMGGDQTHPQSQYAIEGRQVFDQMWSSIRNRVTMPASVDESPWRNTQLVGTRRR